MKPIESVLVLLQAAHLNVWSLLFVFTYSRYLITKPQWNLGQPAISNLPSSSLKI